MPIQASEESVVPERFVAELLRDLDKWIAYCKIEPASPDYISIKGLVQVVGRSKMSMEDMRNHYPKSITNLKFISNVMFWIIMLKPISPIAFSKDGKIVDLPNINEHIALIWGIHTMKNFIKAGKLSEVVSNKEKNVIRAERFIDNYLKVPIYDDNPSTTKFNETKYYLRYKRYTAVNIYESFMYILLPFLYMKRSRNA